MTFIEACESIHSRELEKDFNEEIKVESYLPHQAFKNANHRAVALLHRASRAVENFVSLCIIIHREKNHGEKNIETEQEKTMLIAEMPTEDVELAQTYGFWMG